MLADVSKAVTIYLTPNLMLTAVFLTVFAYLAPAAMLRGQVALPMLTPPQGLCAQPNNAATLTCAVLSVLSTYNMSVFTSNIPSSVLVPSAMTPAFFAIVLVFPFAFFFMCTTSFRHLMGKVGNFWEIPFVQRVSAWIGIGSFVVGLTSFLIIRICLDVLHLFWVSARRTMVDLTIRQTGKFLSKR
ncbi:hypothetical protein EDC04DRAFT_3336 [Pisolithus marmoratus]|nr:hypothetical protein EDC04DRAFT_3336 [Pisolithus marmoratus]